MAIPLGLRNPFFGEYFPLDEIVPQWEEIRAWFRAGRDNSGKPLPWGPNDNRRTLDFWRTILKHFRWARVEYEPDDSADCEEDSYLVVSGRANFKEYCVAIFAILDGMIDRGWEEILIALKVSPSTLRKLHRPELIRLLLDEDAVPSEADDDRAIEPPAFPPAADDKLLHVHSSGGKTTRFAPLT